MKRLTNFPSDYLEIIVSVLLATNHVKGDEVFFHFFPQEEHTVEEYVVRWEIVHVAANEVGFDEIQKILNKVITAYRKVGEGEALPEEMIYDIVTERLSKSRQAAKETKLFNQFIQAVIEKVTA